MEKYRIKSNLSEPQIEADVSNYFGWITSELKTPFRLLDVDESSTGADKLFKNGGLLYIQFKKTEGLYSIKDIAASQRKNRSKLEDIRIFRNQNKYDDDPSLFFGMRRRAKNATEFQNNLLYQLNQQPSTFAFYVAPLTTDKDKYTTLLYNSNFRYQLDPFHYILNMRINNSFKSRIEIVNHIPFLRGNVSIPPIEIIDNQNHYFSYSENGTYVCWHSNELISRDPIRLSETVHNIYSHFYIQDNLIPFEKLIKNLNRILEEFNIDFPIFNSQESQEIEYLRNFGNFIKKEYKIRQFIIAN